MQTFQKFDPRAFLSSEIPGGTPAKAAKRAKAEPIDERTLATLTALAVGHPETQIPTHEHDSGACLAPCSSYDPSGVKRWKEYFDERARVAEHDGEVQRARAECQAYENRISQWLALHPAPSPEGRCCWCHEQDKPSHVVVPFGTLNGAPAWLHPECWGPWHMKRRAAATMALACMGIIPPRQDKSASATRRSNTVAPDA